MESQLFFNIQDLPWLLRHCLHSHWHGQQTKAGNFSVAPLRSIIKVYDILRALAHPNKNCEAK